MAGPGGSVSHGEWQTPATDSFRSRGGDRKDEMGLDQQARTHWPTPTTEIDQGAESERNRRTPSLSSAALWATPEASVSKRGDRTAYCEANPKAGNDLGSQSLQWMTPSVSNSQGNEYTRDRGQKGQERLTLTGQASHWPSPNVQDAEAAGGQGAIERRTRGETLHTMTTQWPTPESRDWRSESGSEEFVANRLSQSRGQTLSFMSVHSGFSHPVLPTLDGQESPSNTQASRRRLNPAFGCWLMGWPWWYTNPGLTSCARSAMESWRHALALHLQSCCAGRD